MRSPSSPSNAARGTKPRMDSLGDPLMTLATLPVMMNTPYAQSGSTRFPEAYSQALATILEFELRRIRGTAVTSDFPPAERARCRFTTVTDYVEERLEGKIAVPELASLMALSVSRFAHAF